MNDVIYAMVDVVPEPAAPRCLFVGGNFTFTTPGHGHKGRLALIRMDDGGYYEASGYAPCINVGVPTAFSKPVYDYPGAPNNPLIYVAGEFSTTSIPLSYNLVKVWCISGSVESSFRPNPNGKVHAAVAEPGMVIAGGAFTTVQSDWGAVTNVSLGYAKINHTLMDGAVKDTAFGGKATLHGVVKAMVTSVDGDVFIGGDFISSSRLDSFFASVASLASPVWAATTGRTTNSFTLNWMPVDDATRYHLDVANDTDFNEMLPGYNNLDVGASTSRQVTGLDAACTYYARLRSWGGGLYSQNSARLAQATRNPPLVPGWEDVTFSAPHSGVHSLQYSPSGDLYLFQSQKDQRNVFMPGAMYLCKRAADADAQDAFGQATLIGGAYTEAALRSHITMLFEGGGINHVVGESSALCMIAQSDDDGAVWNNKRGYSVQDNGLWPAYLPSYFTQDDKLRLFFGIMRFHNNIGVPVVMHVARTDNPFPMEWPMGGSPDIVEIGDGRMCGAYENGNTSAVFTDKGVLVSTDNGASYTTNSEHPACAAAIGASDRLYLLNVVTNEGVKTISLAAGTDAQTWVNPKSVLYTGAEQIAHPKIAAHGDKLMATWLQGSARKLVSRRSSDAGATWGEPVELFKPNTGMKYMVYGDEPGYVLAGNAARFAVAIGITNTVGTLPQLKLSAVALTNSVVLRWPAPTTHGTGSDMVHLRHSGVDYPATLSDGAAVYSGTSQVFTHSNRAPNTPCYYTLWVSHDGETFFDPAITDTSRILLLETED